MNPTGYQLIQPIIFYLVVNCPLNSQSFSWDVVSWNIRFSSVEL